MSSFFAFVNRMKYVQRWGLMRSTVSDNLEEHSLQTAMIAHMLCLIDRKYYGGTLDPDRAAVLAMYHDTAEIITGDMPTPVKYFNGEMRETYKKIEEDANEKLLSLLPEDFREDFRNIVCYEDEQPEYQKIIKAADKISAYLKCVEETRCGNADFASAGKTLLETVQSMDLPCVRYFIDNFAGDFEKSLDELG